MFNYKLTGHRFADDVALLAEQTEGLQKTTLTGVAQESKKWL